MKTWIAELGFWSVFQPQRKQALRNAMYQQVAIMSASRRSMIRMSLKAAQQENPQCQTVFTPLQAVVTKHSITAKHASYKQVQRGLKGGRCCKTYK